MNLKKDYHATMDKVIDINTSDGKTFSLWIGSMMAAQNLEILKENQISSILSAIDYEDWGMEDIHKIVKENKFKHHRINIEDDAGVDIYPFFKDCCNFISECRDNGSNI